MPFASQLAAPFRVQGKGSLDAIGRDVVRVETSRPMPKLVTIVFALGHNVFNCLKWRLSIGHNVFRKDQSKDPQILD